MVRRLTWLILEDKAALQGNHCQSPLDVPGAPHRRTLLEASGQMILVKRKVLM